MVAEIRPVYSVLNGQILQLSGEMLDGYFGLCCISNVVLSDPKLRFSLKPCSVHSPCKHAL